MDRIIVLIDMDCFYVQVEQRKFPSAKGKPCAVVQYNPWKGGGIIAVSYEARKYGVSRGMRGFDAKKVCPDIILLQVPENNGKADITTYREAGAEVIEVLSHFSSCVERASIDEAFIDMTEAVEERLLKFDIDSKITLDKLPQTYVVGWDKKKENQNDTDEEVRCSGLNEWLDLVFHPDTADTHSQQLATAAIITEEMRAAVLKKLGFQCSAGIAHNKMIAKFVCGLHKPNRQTIVPQDCVAELFKTTPLQKIRNLGGKLGDTLVEHFGIKTMADLSQLTEQQLVQYFKQKTGSWLYQIGQGIDIEPVIARHLPKSIGCSKNFPGKTSLSTKDEVKHWVTMLTAELEIRLNKDKEANSRCAKLLTVSCSQKDFQNTRSCAVYQYDQEFLIRDAMRLLNKFNTASHHSSAWIPPVFNISMCAGKFLDINPGETSSHSIKEFLTSTKNRKPSCNPSGMTYDCEPSTSKEQHSLNEIASTSKEQSSLNVKPSTSKEQPSLNKIPSISKEQPSLNEKPSMSKQQLSLNEKLCSNKEQYSLIEKHSVSKEQPSPNEKLGMSKEKLSFSEEPCSSKEESSNAKFPEKKQQEYTSEMTAGKKLPLKFVNKETIGFFASKMKELQKKSSSDSQNISSFLQNEDTLPQEKTVLKSMSFCLPLESKKVDLKILEACPSDIKAIEKKFSSTTNDKLMENVILEECLDLSKETCSLQMSTNDFTETAVSNPELCEACKKCGKQIVIWEMQEHTDYHLALDLQNEMKNSRTIQTISLKKNVNKTGKRKLKSGIKSSDKKAKPATNKTLYEFFRKDSNQ